MEHPTEGNQPVCDSKRNIDLADVTLHVTNTPETVIIEAETTVELNCR